MERYVPKLTFTERGSPVSNSDNYLIEGHLENEGSDRLLGIYSRTESCEDRFRAGESLAGKIKKEGISSLILMDCKLQRTGFITDVVAGLKRKGVAVEVQKNGF